MIYILHTLDPAAEGDPAHHVYKKNREHDGQDRLRRQDQERAKELAGTAEELVCS